MPVEPALIPSPCSDDYVIAADRGYETLTAAGIVPDLVCGDFDSLGHVPVHPNLVSLPAEKDDTDTLYCLRRGLDLGYRRFVILGGIGGRLDHTIANLQCLAFLERHGAFGVLAGGGTAALVLRDARLIFPPEMHGMLSVFTMGDRAEGIDMTGVKYAVHDFTMENSCPTGVSNEFTGVPACIQVRSGTLLLLWEETGEHFYSLLPRLQPEQF